MILPCLETTVCALTVWWLLLPLVLEETEFASESSVARFSVQSANSILIAAFRLLQKCLSLGKKCAAAWCVNRKAAERWEVYRR